MDTLPDGIAVGSTQSHMPLRQDRVGSVEDWKDWVGSVEDWKHPRWERSRTKALPHFVIVGSRGIYGRMGTLPKGIAVGSTQSHVPLRWDRDLKGLAVVRLGSQWDQGRPTLPNSWFRLGFAGGFVLSHVVSRWDQGSHILSHGRIALRFLGRLTIGRVGSPWEQGRFTLSHGGTGFGFHAVPYLLTRLTHVQAHQ